MTRRTRLDVDDRTIRRILLQKLNQGNGSQLQGSRSSVWTVILLLLLLGVNGIAIFQTNLFKKHNAPIQLKPPSEVPLSSKRESQSSNPISKSTPVSPPIEQKTPAIQAAPTTVENNSQPLPSVSTVLTQKIQVEVLNGCGVPGLARRTMRLLRKIGFDVVNTDNYKTNTVRQTFIIDRVGNKAKAEKLAQAVGIPASRIRTEKDLSLALDVTLVLGTDYINLRLFRK